MGIIAEFPQDFFCFFLAGLFGQYYIPGMDPQAGGRPEQAPFVDLGRRIVPDEESGQRQVLSCEFFLEFPAYFFCDRFPGHDDLFHGISL